MKFADGPSWIPSSSLKLIDLEFMAVAVTFKESCTSLGRALFRLALADGKAARVGFWLFWWLLIHHFLSG